MVDAGEDLHEGALARAVLTDEGVYFPRKELKIDILQRVHRPKVLRHTGQLEDWGGFRHRLPTSRTSTPRSLTVPT